LMEKIFIRIWGKNAIIVDTEIFYYSTLESTFVLDAR